MGTSFHRLYLFERGDCVTLYGDESRLAQAYFSPQSSSSMPETRTHYICEYCGTETHQKAIPCVECGELDYETVEERVPQEDVESDDFDWPVWLKLIAGVVVVLGLLFVLLQTGAF